MRDIVKALIVLYVASVPGWTQVNTDISGEYYDWQKTLQPEHPWNYDYSQTLLVSMFLCSRDAVGDVDGKVYLSFDDALSVIKKFDNLTLGIPKIVYLVGWQFTGHDSGYPSWSVVNDRLKRKEDKTALDSLRWLMQQARQYHTTVTLHINMHDAYRNSPLWKAYDENNIVLKDRAGNPIKGDVFDGMQSYQISYDQEWKTGFAQKRIDDLLKMLPELKQAGTVHIDAFHSIQRVRKNDGDGRSSPYLDNTIDDEIAAQRKIFRYWRKQGLDVTSEYGINDLRKDPFIVLQPLALHFSNVDFREREWLGKPVHFAGLPPKSYTGTPGEGIDLSSDPKNLTGVAVQFCTEVMPWYWRNNARSKPEELGTTNEQGGDILLPAHSSLPRWSHAALMGTFRKPGIYRHHGTGRRASACLGLP